MALSILGPDIGCFLFARINKLYLQQRDMGHLVILLKYGKLRLDRQTEPELCVNGSECLRGGQQHVRNLIHSWNQKSKKVNVYNLSPNITKVVPG